MFDIQVHCGVLFCFWLVVSVYWARSPRNGLRLSCDRD